MAFSIAQTGTASDMGGVPGDCRYVFKTATFTSTYAAGSMTAADLGLEQLFIVIAEPESVGLVAQYDYTNATLDLYEAGADGAVLDEGNTGGADVTVRILAFGR